MIPNTTQRAFFNELDKITFRKTASWGTALRGFGKSVLESFKPSRIKAGIVGGKGLKEGEESLLDVAKKVKKAPLKEMKKYWKEMPKWHYPLVGLAGYSTMADPTRTKGERIGTTAGMLAGWPLMTKVPFWPAMGGWIAAEQAGKLIGRGVGKAFGEKKVRLPIEKGTIGKKYV